MSTRKWKKELISTEYAHRICITQTLMMNNQGKTEILCTETKKPHLKF